MIAQLISFFLPKNSQNFTTSGACCHAHESTETEDSELTQTKNLPLKQKIYRARLHKIALPLIREQRFSLVADSSNSEQTDKENTIEDFPLG